MSVYCHSFDVFDTCLLRDLAVPSDLFFAVAEDLAAWLEPQLGPDYRHVFFTLRKQAQAEARAASAAEDVTLAQIWERLATKLPGLDAQAGMAAELAAEAAALGPNRAVLEQVRALEAAGARVVFVSDCYLPADAVQAALQAAGFPARADNLYVSNEIGLTKSRSGALFRHVLKSEGVSASRMLHHGDGWLADVRMARRVGIGARHVTATRLTRIERALLAAAAPRDVLFVSRLVGAMRRFRLDAVDAGDAARNFTAAFSGPFLFVFASWLAGRARAGGVERLYFVARDGYRLWCMAEAMPRAFDGIACRYLHVSRQALYLPELERVAPEEMPWLIGPGEPLHLGTILAKLELRPDHPALADLAAAAGPEGMLAPGQEAELMARLCCPPLSTQIAATAATRRDAALAFLEAEGLLEPGRAAIADLGWKLTTQRALRILLRRRGGGGELRGFYLGLSREPYGPAETGAVEALFYAAGLEWSHQTGMRGIAGRTRVLEHILSGAPHGSVQRYVRDPGGRAMPVCAETEPRTAPVEERLAHLAQDFAARLDAACGGAVPGEPALLLEALMRDALAHPEPGWAAALGEIRVGVGKSNLNTVPLLQPYRWRDIPRRLAGGTLALRPWPELSRTAAPWGMRLAIAGEQALMAWLRRVRGLLRRARR